MKRPPIGEAPGKRAQVEAMFDAVAPRYDLLNRVLSFGVDIWWRRQAVGLLEEERIRRLLDVATGTADLAIAAARRFPEAEVVGVDIAADMLAVGRAKLPGRGLGGRVTLQRGDAAELPFEDDAFDAAFVAFGVRNFEHLRAGLADIRRVLRPGGTLVVLEFSRPRAFPIKQLYALYSAYVLPRIGGLLSESSAYTYLPASVAAFPDGFDFLDRMDDAGYTDLYWRPLTFGIASLYRGRVGREEGNGKRVGEDGE